MFQDHNKLIGMILTEEEDLIENHKQHVNEIINIEKDEMNLISEVYISGSDVESYIEKLDSMLL
jgi:kinesin family protein 2/24